MIGSGLGLNICRGILEKHGAQYGVRSEEGQGTTFWFELPRGQQKKGTEIHHSPLRIRFLQKKSG